jgi:hypothetical protein
VWIHISSPVSDRESVGHPVASSPREDGIISMPIMAGDGSMTFGPAWAEGYEVEGL